MDCQKREQKTLNKRKDAFISKGQEKYGSERYDYSMVDEEYVNNRIPVHLICNNCHGEPFLVIPSRHTEKGDNQRGSCPNCYEPKETVQETRWDPNLSERIEDFVARVNKKHKGTLIMPHVHEEYKNEYSKITAVCTECKGSDVSPFQQLALSLKSKTRIGGCPECNKRKNQEKINQKIRDRQLRNKNTQGQPKEYGCIYKITNALDCKFYIGYSSMSAQKRFRAHIDETRRMEKSYPEKTSYLHRAMSHHGIENFSVEILEEFTNVSPVFLAELEMETIAKENPNYNLSPGGEIAYGYGSKKKSKKKGKK